MARSIREYYHNKWNVQSNASHAIKERIDEILAVISRHNIELTNVLEVGCGAGHLAISISKIASGHVLGIDLALEVAPWKKFANERLSFKSADVFENNLDLETWKIVISSEVIEHVYRERQLEFMQRLAALTEIGGYIIITTPNAVLSNNFLLENEHVQPIEEPLTREQIIGLVERTNLKIIEHHFFHSIYLNRGILRALFRKLHLLRLFYIPFIIPVLELFKSKEKTRLYQLLVLKKEE